METGAVVVRAVGVISMYAVIVQLAVGGAMPYTPLPLLSLLVQVGGLSVLPQVMWSTFVPYLPQSILSGILSFTTALTTVNLTHFGKLSKKAVEFVGSISGWTTTLLFMWMPIAQMWTNYLNPENIRGSSWAAFLYGWGNILSVYIYGGIIDIYFWTIKSALLFSM